jgi:hypothetical protein
MLWQLPLSDYRVPLAPEFQLESKDPPVPFVFKSLVCLPVCPYPFGMNDLCLIEISPFKSSAKTQAWFSTYDGQRLPTHPQITLHKQLPAFQHIKYSYYFYYYLPPTCMSENKCTTKTTVSFCGGQ